MPCSPGPVRVGLRGEWPGELRWVAMETECRFAGIAFLFARHCNTSYVEAGEWVVAGEAGAGEAGCAFPGRRGSWGGLGWCRGRGVGGLSLAARRPALGLSAGLGWRARGAGPAPALAPEPLSRSSPVLLRLTLHTDPPTEHKAAARAREK